MSDDPRVADLAELIELFLNASAEPYELWVEVKKRVNSRFFLRRAERRTG